MINFQPTYIEISPAVAQALVAFSGSDTIAIGISGGRLGATNAYAAVQFDTGKQSAEPTPPDGTVWSKVYVADKLAKLWKVGRTFKNKSVYLYLEDAIPEGRFPTLAHVMPKPAITADEPVAFNPKFTEPLGKVTRAVGCEFIKLTSHNGRFDAIGFTAVNDDTGLTAHVAIMPANIP